MRTWWRSALAPAIVTYQWGVVRIAEFGKEWGRFGWLAAFFYAVAAALRLARFNARSAIVGQAVFRGAAEPVGGGRRCGFRLVFAVTGASRG